MVGTPVITANVWSNTFGIWMIPMASTLMDKELQAKSLLLLPPNQLLFLFESRIQLEIQEQSRSKSQ